MIIKKKLLFYSIHSVGHFNVCAAIGSVLLDRYDDRIEIWFVVDNYWKEKLSKYDSRFKFGSYELKNEHNRMVNIVEELEKGLELDYLDRMRFVWKTFCEKDEEIIIIDQEAEKQIKLIKPDYMLCDHVWCVPAIHNSKIPFGFITSTNPILISDTIDGYVRYGMPNRMDEPEKNKEFEKEYKVFKKEVHEIIRKFYEKRQSIYTGTKDAEYLGSDHFSIYSFPEELDYYDDNFRKEHNFWQIDSALYPAKIPEAFKLPEEFKKINLPLIYVSLGSLFSSLAHRLQNLIDILDKLPYKYIISMGVNHEKLVFPTAKWIGEDYIDQLAVLQVTDLMISHGGNNSLCETFYFGVPSLIIPLYFDQINNASRIEEMNFGQRINLDEINEKSLSEKLEKILNDKELKIRLQKVSQRIQDEKRIIKVCDQIMDYLTNKL